MLWYTKAFKIKHPQDLMRSLLVFFSSDGKFCTPWISLWKQWTAWYPLLPPWTVILGAPEWFELTWQSSVECVFFTCWQPAKRAREIESERERQRERQREDGSSLVVLCCPVVYLPVRLPAGETRTPGQLIKVRCGWMPGVTHDPCPAPSTLPTTPSNTHTHTHTTDFFSLSSSSMPFLYLSVSFSEPHRCTHIPTSFYSSAHTHQHTQYPLSMTFGDRECLLFLSWQ